MPKGNPNPSPETRFKPGNQYGGKTSEQKRLEYEAAEMAAQLRHRMLSVITEKLAAPDAVVADVLEYVKADVLRLMKDSEDRAHGTPVQAAQIDHTNSDGSLRAPTEIRLVPLDDSDGPSDTGEADPGLHGAS